MSDYSDKSFKELYSEIIDYVKSLTTKWDPSVADEADPGVVILKSAGLLYDKINYRINYRNAQNSVREVTDQVEGENLFYDLGYQVKKKKSASGQIRVRYLNSAESDQAVLPLFTQFSDQSNSITFTSVRKQVGIKKGETKLIDVQEGIPVRYEYLGRKVFTDEDLTNNLRLSLAGYDNISSNGVIICSYSGESEGIENYPLVSEWLNTGDNPFTAVETDNIFSIGRDSEGVNYIQFYEESLKGLSKGIQIWVLSSYGSAGNIPSNKLSKIYSSENSELDTSEFVISHETFNNGQDPESLLSAKENYYKTLGINNSLVSARDYSGILESVIGPNLYKIISKALVSDISGNHNQVQILSKSSNGNSIYLRYLTSGFIAGILVNALKASNDYYESFQLLTDDETLNLIKKAIFDKNVISNEIELVKPERPIYNRFIFDLADISGMVIVNSIETDDSIKNKIRDVLGKFFNSSKLTPGKLISELEMSRAVKENVQGVVDCSFYYTDHNLYTSISRNGEGSGEISDEDKEDLVARSVLRGDLPLFKRKQMLLPVGSTGPRIENGGDEVIEIGGKENGKIIKSISGRFFSTPVGKKKTHTLAKNEFIQFYREALVDSQVYGMGVKILFLAKPTTITEETIFNSDSGYPGVLLKGSIIPKGSQIYSKPGKEYTIGGKTYTGGIITEYEVEESSIGSLPNPNYGAIVAVKDDKGELLYYLVNSESGYVVENYIVYDLNTSFSKNLVISDGSYFDGQPVYSKKIENGVNYTISGETKLLLKIGKGENDIVEISGDSEFRDVRVENFTDGLVSMGDTSSRDWSKGYSLVGETITLLKPDETKLKISDKFKYILISNTDLNDLFEQGVTEYLLGENEHFIYSDSDLLDFVDFGSGTLLKLGGEEPNPADWLKLTKEPTLGEDLANRLVDLTIPITLINTDIYSFYSESGSDTVKLDLSESKRCLARNLPEGDEDKILTNEWDALVGNEKIEITVNGETTVFDSDISRGYRVRIGLILKSGENMVIPMYSNQELTLSYTNGEKENLVFTESGNFISPTSPLYLNSATNSDLSSYNLGIKVFRLHSLSSDSDYNDGFKVNSNSYDPEKGFIYSNSLVGNGGGFLILRTGGGEYLLKINFRSDSNSQSSSESKPELEAYLVKKNIKDGGQWVDLAGGQLKIIDRKSNILELGQQGIFYIPKYNEDSETIYGVKFIVKGGRSGDTIEIESQTELEGYNPDLFFFSSDPSQNISSDKGNDIFQKVISLSTGKGDEAVESGSNPPIRFNFEYVADSQVKKPTEAIKYYDEQHLLNRNILTVLNLKGLIDNDNLKIIRRTR